MKVSFEIALLTVYPNVIMNEARWRRAYLKNEEGRRENHE